MVLIEPEHQHVTVSAIELLPGDDSGQRRRVFTDSCGFRTSAVNGLECDPGCRGSLKPLGGFEFSGRRGLDLVCALNLDLRRLTRLGLVWQPIADVLFVRRHVTGDVQRRQHGIAQSTPGLGDLR